MKGLHIHKSIYTLVNIASSKISNYGNSIMYSITKLTFHKLNVQSMITIKFWSLQTPHILGT